MARDFDIKPGDVFASEGGMGFISKAIIGVERFNSHDNEATYGHAGIFIDRHTILDTLWTVHRTDLSRYQGQKIIVARPERTIYGGYISEREKKMALARLEMADIGDLYPVHRIFLHLIPPIAKYLSAGHMKVCSERAAFYLSGIGARPLPWAGATPDILADEWRHWVNYKKLYEGRL